ncbi:MAG: glycosyl transferase group 1 [Gemmatimonadetes bacterium]|nr:glycosyl transferase group 1 [Gemmatimonadota bacterium]
MLYCDSPSSGGFEQLVGRLANVLASAGHDVELLYWHEKLGALADHPALRKTRIETPTKGPLSFVRAFYPPALWRLARELRARRGDLLVICQGTIEIGARALIAARLLNMPTVSYLAFAFDLRAIGARLGALREVVDGLFYRLPRRFIALSEFQRELVQRRVHAPTRVIPMVIPRVAAGTERQDRGTERILELGVVGTVSFATKGHDVLPELSVALERRGTRARIHVVGDGPDLPRLRRLIAEQNLTDRFVIHGLLPYGAPREMMQWFDVLLIPSRFEGAVPLVGFEALAAGTPIATSLLPSTRDWHIPREIQFDRDSPKEIMRAIDAALRLRASPDFAPFCTRMLDTVTEELFARTALEVFAELLEAVR